MSVARVRAFRASILHYRDDPGTAAASSSHEFHEDGLLIVEEGRVARIGPAPPLLASLPRDVEVVDRRGCLILPGFVDAHIHYSQTDVIASAGRNLLHWLEQYTFPEEARFAERAHADEVAEFFLDQLLANGTTTALVFCTVHRASADAFFEAAERRKVRMGAGQVMMDRLCPANLRDTPDSARKDAHELIERWDGRGRLHYAITPRFAITSSSEQLKLAGELARAHPSAFIHTHVAEQPDEVAKVRELFPNSRSYLDAYAHRGLLRERAILCAPRPAAGARDLCALPLPRPVRPRTHAIRGCRSRLLPDLEPVPRERTFRHRGSGRSRIAVRARHRRRRGDELQPAAHAR